MRDAPTRPGCRCEYCRGRRERRIPPHLKPATWEPGMQPVTVREQWADWLVRSSALQPLTLDAQRARELARLLVEER